MLIHLQPRKRTARHHLIVDTLRDTVESNHRQEFQKRNSVNNSYQQCLISPKKYEKQTGKQEENKRKLSYIDYELNVSLVSPKTKILEKELSSERSGILEIPNLYKKSFKYNTTIHQIIKNFTKNKDPKEKKVQQSLSANKIIKFQFLQSSYRRHRQSHQGLDQGDKRSERKVELEKETIFQKSERVSIKELVENANSEDQHIHKIHFRNNNNSNKKEESSFRTKQIQFLGTSKIEECHKYKSTHTTFARLTNRNSSKLRSNAKQSLSLENKIDKNPYRISQKLNTLIAIRQLQYLKNNPEMWNDSKIQTKKVEDLKPLRNLIKSQTQPKEKSIVNEKEEDLDTIQRVKRERNRKMTHRIKKIHSRSQFNVDAWNTNEEQQVGHLFGYNKS